MNKQPRLAVLFIVLSLLQMMSLLQPSPLPAAKITIDSVDQFEFARRTMEKGEFLRAVGEFERLVYFFPEDETVPEARYLIGLCYLKAKDYESARKVLADAHKAYAGDPVGGKALFLIGESYYIQGLPGEAERYFNRVIKEYPMPALKSRALYRLGWSRMQRDRWQEASEFFKTVDENSPLHTRAMELSSMSLQGMELPRKDPATAGIMAGVLPGLGHAYCNRYKDGLVAFLLNGLFLWAAVESFEEGHDVLGGVLSFLELGWYSGNIYSAVNCAHKHNRAIRDNYRGTLSDKLDLSLFSTGERHLGLALKIDF
jgi:tetratricopeptide (TPR) repeat protein